MFVIIFTLLNQIYPERLESTKTWVSTYILITVSVKCNNQQYWRVLKGADLKIEKKFEFEFIYKFNTSDYFIYMFCINLLILADKLMVIYW